MTRMPGWEQALQTLRSAFGYDRFRPGQEEAVRSILARRDTVVVLPTGGGKSVCYQVPGLLLPGVTVVVSPLISLMKDQVDALTARGLPAAFINSTVSASQAADRMARAARGALKLLYVAPERFDAGNTAERLRAIGVSLLAIDEAHCISEWGHDFRPSYLRIGAVRRQLGTPTTVALTATATPEVRRDIAQQLGLVDPRTIVTGFDRKNLHLHVQPTRTDADKDAALAAALQERPGSAIVYASTRKAVERVARVLDRSGVANAAYHAGLDDARRHEVQDDFMRGRVRAIVATNAFGMGIDKPDVRLVVHYAMPGTLEAYYQEAGRAGRDGLQSACVLLHAFPDRFTHEFFIKGAYPERGVVERVYEVLRTLAGDPALEPLDAAAIAARVGGKSGAREVESALRVLERSGAVVGESDASSRLFVRLLATPERIRRELHGGDDVELGLLRALWRAVGASIHDGALVDAEGLPPGFGGTAGVVPVLTALQQRQFLVWERAGGGRRLTTPGAPLSRFDIDWGALDRRRTTELSKLDRMQRYAYTTSCRRGFILRYFGDSSGDATCGACDNCLGTHAGTQRDPPTRAAGSRRAAGGRTARGRAQSPPPRAAERATAGARAADAELRPGDALLLAELRTLRSTLARAHGVPAYVVFPDRTLVEIAVRRPGTLASLGEVHGVGPAKLERYGEQVLAAIRRSTDTEAA